MHRFLYRSVAVLVISSLVLGPEITYGFSEYDRVVPAPSMGLQVFLKMETLAVIGRHFPHRQQIDHGRGSFEQSSSVSKPIRPRPRGARTMVMPASLVTMGLLAAAYVGDSVSILAVGMVGATWISLRSHRSSVAARMESHFPFHRLGDHEERSRENRIYRITPVKDAPTLYESFPADFKDGDLIVLCNPGKIHLEGIYFLRGELKRRNGEPRDAYYWGPEGLASAISVHLAGIVMLSESLSYSEELKGTRFDHALRYARAFAELSRRYPKSKFILYGSSVGAHIQLLALAQGYVLSEKVLAVISGNTAIRIEGKLLQALRFEAPLIKRHVGEGALNLIEGIIAGAPMHVWEPLGRMLNVDFIFMAAEKLDKHGRPLKSDGVVNLDYALGRGIGPSHAMSFQMRNLVHAQWTRHPRHHALANQILRAYIRNRGIRKWEVRKNGELQGLAETFTPARPFVFDIEHDRIDVQQHVPSRAETKAMLARWRSHGLGLAKWTRKVARGWWASRQASRRSTRGKWAHPVVAILSTSYYLEAFGGGLLLLIGWAAIQVSRKLRRPVSEPKIQQAPVFSAFQREQAIRDIDGKSVEVQVVGTGVTATSAAAHLPHYGIKNVLLAGRGYFASEASGNNSSLAHVYIAYLLELLFGFLFKEAVRKQYLSVVANHLVRPIPILLVAAENGPFSLNLLRGATALHDLLFRLTGLLTGIPVGPLPRFWSPANLLVRVPTLSSSVRGATEYFIEGQLADANLTIQYAQTAYALGVPVLTHVSLVSFIKDGEQVVGVNYRDDLTGRLFSVRSKLTVLAVGGSTNRLLRLAGRTPKVIDTQKGVHLIVDRLSETMLVIPSRKGRGALLVMPYGEDLSIVGTTSTPDIGDPRDTLATPEDLIEIVEQIFDFMPSVRPDVENDRLAVQQYVVQHVHDVYWGVRAQNGMNGSKEFYVSDPDRGLMVSYGAKLTAGAAVGETIGQKAASYIQGAEVLQQPLLALVTRVPPHFLERNDLRYFIERFGAFYPTLRDIAQEKPEYAERVFPNDPRIYAEVVYAVRHEAAVRLNDFLWGGSRWARGRLLPESVIERVAGIMAAELGWSPLVTDHEIASYYLRHSIHRPPVIPDKPAERRLSQAA